MCLHLCSKLVYLLLHLLLLRQLLLHLSLLLQLSGRAGQLMVALCPTIRTAWCSCGCRERHRRPQRSVGGSRQRSWVQLPLLQLLALAHQA